MSDTFQIVNMTEDEDRMAVEAHIRALVLLEDALQKKDWLLLDREREHMRKESDPNCPFLHQQLVLDLIHKLQKVHLLKKKRGLEKEASLVTIYPDPSLVNVVLCQCFWEKREYLGLGSRPGALILAASQILSYTDHVWGKDHATLPASDICSAFEIWMNHDGVYENGVYMCCGEKVRDSVCEQSCMSHHLLPYITESDERDLKRVTLDILLDSQAKRLLVELTEEPEALLTIPTFPIIRTSLVQELISKLKAVKFKCDNRPDSVRIAYTDPRIKNVIYVCPLFWNEKDYLCPGSRPGTIILHVAQLLGYQHDLDGAKVNTSNRTLQHDKRSSSPTSMTTTINKDIDNRGPSLSLRSSSLSDSKVSLFQRSEISTTNKTTADTICAAFEIWMKHQGNYENGSYTCCMETARHSVCAKSVMRSCLKELESVMEQDPSEIKVKRPRASNEL